MAFLPTVRLSPTTAIPQFSSPVALGSFPTVAPSSTTAFSATIAYLTEAPFFITAPGIISEYSTVAPSSTVTFLNKTE